MKSSGRTIGSFGSRGGLGEHVRFRRLQGQGQAGEDVRDQIDPEELHGVQRLAEPGRRAVKITMISLILVARRKWIDLRILL